MDEFLSDIHTIVFKHWILSQKHKDYNIKLNEKDVNTITIDTKYGIGTIVFNDMNIIEFSVLNRATDEILFYLHFQMKTIKHAIKLYNEMMECLKELVNQPTIRVLLCCSGGYTTSYFAMKIEEAAQVLNLNLEVRAVGYNKLYHEGENYDVILLAPQISYIYSKVKEIIKDKIILKIPTKVFASYDVGAILSIVLKETKEQVSKNVSENHPLPIKVKINKRIEMLSLSIYRNRDKVYIAYRLYDKHQNIILNNEIIKVSISIDDIYDVIDTILATHPEIVVIGISISSQVNRGYIVEKFIEGLSTDNLRGLLIDKYKKNFIITNDANNASVGYYASQSETSSVAFVFQPTNSVAGTGIIVDGSLIFGKNSIAGEVKYLPMNLSDTMEKLSLTPEGTLELVSKTMLSIISVIGPEVIALYSDLITDVEEIKKVLLEYIPEQYIPRIVKVNDLKEYILLGQMIYCLQN